MNAYTSVAKYGLCTFLRVNQHGIDSISWHGRTVASLYILVHSDGSITSLDTAQKCGSSASAVSSHSVHVVRL